MDKVASDENTVDLSGWDFESIGDLENQIYEAMASDQTYIYLPYEWFPNDGIGGKSPDNPLTLYLRYGLFDENDGEPPCVETTLNDIVEDFLDNFKVSGKIKDPKDIKVVEMVISGLQDLIAHMQSTLSQPDLSIVNKDK